MEDQTIASLAFRETWGRIWTRDHSFRMVEDRATNRIGNHFMTLLITPGTLKSKSTVGTVSVCHCQEFRTWNVAWQSPGGQRFPFQSRDWLFWLWFVYSFRHAEIISETCPWPHPSQHIGKRHAISCITGCKVIKRVEAIEESWLQWLIAGLFDGDYSIAEVV